MATESIGDNMYVVGGWINSDSNNSTNVTQIYNATSNSWSSGAPAPTTRGATASAVIDGKMYVTGGSAWTYTQFPALEIYDIATNSWSTSFTPAPIPIWRDGAAGEAVNGKFYVIGGSDVYFWQNPIGDVAIYDPVTNAWTSGAPMPTPCVVGASGVIDGKIYIVGGIFRDSGGNLAYSDAVQVYDPVANSWSTDTSMLSRRFYHTAEVIQNRLYITGGSASSAVFPPLNTLEVFTPSMQHAPVANDFSVTTTTVSITIPVLDYASDADNDPLSVVSVTDGNNGTVVINPNGTVTYTLTTFVNVADYFTYTVSDGLQAATATVTVNVQVPPAQGIEMIQSQVTLLPLNNGAKNALTAKLDVAQKSLANSNEGAAANQLNAFVNELRALQKTGRIDSSIADRLIEEAQEIVGLLS